MDRRSRRPAKKAVESLVLAELDILSFHRSTKQVHNYEAIRDEGRRS